MAVALVVMTLTALASFGVSAQQNQMSFFVTSAGSGNGANLGGVAGADKICQTLAAAAGAGNRMWRAYISAGAAAGQPAVNAKDRIGKGPWMNVKGVVIAKSVEDLHSDNNNLKKDTALTEKGTVVNGVGDTPNQHDILTGSQSTARWRWARTAARRRARIGRQPPTAWARHSSDTSIAWVVARRARHGTTPIRRAGARRRISSPRVATDTCTASLRINDVAGPKGPALREVLMNRMRALCVLAVLVLAPAPRAHAQLLAAKDGPIVYGHHHLLVTNVADHKKFWVDTPWWYGHHDRHAESRDRQVPERAAVHESRDADSREPGEAR
jgi:hypothetical protein